LSVEKPVLALSLSFVIGLLWAGWVVLSAHGLANGFNAFDLTLFRFAVPALVTLPWFIRSPHSRDWRKLLVVGACIGAPHALLIQIGLIQAGTAHAGVILPSFVPIFAIGLAWLILRQRPTAMAGLGLALIAAGAFLIILSDAGSLTDFAPVWPGDALFLCAAFLWAVFTIAITIWRMPPMETVSIVAVMSTVVYAPVYLVFLPHSLDQAPLSEYLIQVPFQGLLGIVMAMGLYAVVVRLAGPQRAATITATVPILTLLLAIPLLDEYPSWLDTAGALAAGAGIWVIVTRGQRVTPPAPEAGT
jgi:drug/metabolite transporter (DMT)-like permease